jgi:HK97 family phage major capsid protein
MALTIHEIMQKRRSAKNFSEKANALLKASAGRDMTAEEDSQWNGYMAEAEKLVGEASAAETELDGELARKEREYRAGALSNEVARGVRGAIAERSRVIAADPLVAAAITAEDASLRSAAARSFGEDYRRTLSVYLRGGYSQLSLEERAVLRPPREFLEELKREDPTTYAAVATGVDTTLGYLVPQEALQPMVTATKYYGGMYEAAEVIPTDTGREIPYPTTDDTATMGRYIGENRPVTEVSAGTAGVVPIKAYTCTSDIVLVPQEFLQDVGIDFDAWLMARFGERIGRRRNLACTTGDGSLGPLGVVPSATLGVTGPTGQTTTVTFLDLLDLEGSVDRTYRDGAIIMAADGTITKLKKQVDGVGRPLWQLRVDLRQPPTINDYPYVVNSDVATLAASAKSVLFGNFKNYKLRVVRARWVRRLEERYAENGQVGFIMYERHDGRLIDAGQHPIKYFQNPAS